MNKGSYLLLIELSEKEELQYGRRKLSFNKGYYIYVGSAMANLKQRVDRHLSFKEKGYKKHWHIDNLLERGKIIATMVLPNSERKEEELSLLISGKAKKIPGFGATDCRRTDTNLFYLKSLDEYYNIARKALEFNWETSSTIAGNKN